MGHGFGGGFGGMGGPGGGFGGGHGHGFGGRASKGTTYTLTSDSDSITGTSNNDTITATSSTFGSGDSIDGGSGYDVLKLTDAGTFDLNSLASLTNVEEIRGASSAAQVITLLDGADMKFVGGKGDTTITTGATGNQNITLGSGTNTVVAQDGTTFVTTTGGTNTITGGSGELTVNAKYGVTTVVAGSGGSHVDIGYGTLTVTGGDGTDTIDIGQGRGTATINSFTQGTDTIDVSHLGYSSYSELTEEATVTTSGSDTVITFDYGPTVTLVGISSVTESDFTFAA